MTHNIYLYSNVLHILYTPTFYTYYKLQRLSTTNTHTQQTREYNYYFKHSTLELVNWCIRVHACVGVHVQEISLKSYLDHFIGYWNIQVP